MSVSFFSVVALPTETYPDNNWSQCLLNPPKQVGWEKEVFSTCEAIAERKENDLAKQEYYKILFSSLGARVHLFSLYLFTAGCNSSWCSLLAWKEKCDIQSFLNIRPTYNKLTKGEQAKFLSFMQKNPEIYRAFATYAPPIFAELSADNKKLLLQYLLYDAPCAITAYFLKNMNNEFRVFFTKELQKQLPKTWQENLHGILLELHNDMATSAIRAIYDSLKQKKITYLAFLHLQKQSFSSPLTSKLDNWSVSLSVDGIYSKLLYLVFAKKQVLSKLARRYLSQDVTSIFQKFLDEKTPKQLARFFLLNPKEPIPVAMLFKGESSQTEAVSLCVENALFRVMIRDKEKTSQVLQEILLRIKDDYSTKEEVLAFIKEKALLFPKTGLSEKLAKLTMTEPL